MGTISKEGLYETAELESSAAMEDDEEEPAPTSFLSSLFTGSKTITSTDLDPRIFLFTDIYLVLDNLSHHLIEKNVAAQVCEHLCTRVRDALLNTSVSTFSRTNSLVRAEMERAIHRILAPSSSTDILRDIISKRGT